MFSTEPNLDRAKASYLAQFAHVGCGGAPVAEAGTIACAKCGARWVWLGTLEYTMWQLAKEFHSLKV